MMNVILDDENLAGLGKIYCLESSETELIYIGSTIQPLKYRLAQHKSDYKRHVSGLTRGTTATQILQYEDTKIKLLRTVDAHENLKQIEGYFIRAMRCVNHNIPNRTQKEYYKDNRDHLLNKQLSYYQQNKEARKAYQRRYSAIHR